MSQIAGHFFSNCILNQRLHAIITVTDSRVATPRVICTTIILNDLEAMLVKQRFTIEFVSISLRRVPYSGSLFGGNSICVVWWGE